MKVAYVTRGPVDDIHQFSGSSLFMFRALLDQGLDLEAVDRLRVRYRWVWRLKTLYYRRLFRLRYQVSQEPMQIRYYARQVRERIARTKPDIVFSPGSIPVALLDTAAPIAFWLDAPFDAHLKFYPDLCRSTIRNGHWMEQQALQRASLAIYSSQWGADEARRHYDVDPKKLRVVPFGANIAPVPARDEVLGFLERRSQTVCRLVFIATNWEYKGGATAVDAARRLNHGGIQTQLTLIGAPPQVSLPPFVQYLGYVDKASEAGMASLLQTLSESHFLLLPTRADCVPVVIAEAAAMGVPSITTRVGGISTAVKDSVTGFLLDAGDPPERFADCIARAFVDRSAYLEMARAARALYESELNWPVAAGRVAGMLRSLCPCSGTPR